MKTTAQELSHLVEKVFAAWKKNNVIVFKADEKVVFARALKALQDDLQKEFDLDREVLRMLDDLEQKHSGEFQRSKMRTILKQKLAKEKKVIL